MQVVEVVLAQVDAVEKDLSFRGIVEAGDELDHGGLALAVFSNEGNAFSGLNGEIEILQHPSLGAGIGERDVAEFKSAADRTGHGERIGLALYGRLHLEKGDQIGKEQRLIRNPEAVENACCRFELAC